MPFHAAARERGACWAIHAPVGMRRQLNALNCHQRVPRCQFVNVIHVYGQQAVSTLPETVLVPANVCRLTLSLTDPAVSTAT